MFPMAFLILTLADVHSLELSLLDVEVALLVEWAELAFLLFGLIVVVVVAVGLD